ncbi:MAG: Rieske (2Fe-2S) protein [Verrucomicrobia bacterium]|nr:MAG: Rieske (2Fe-2S) protein [Verrucomicrobiota bacterium]
MKPESHRKINLGRRHFLRLSSLWCAACAAGNGNAIAAALTSERMVDAGPIGNFSHDGVHDKFRGLGFFVIRRQGKLLALSAVCTHKKCKLAAETDGSFYCDCHGSTFDPSGKVTEGPAKRDLPFLSTQVNEHGHLLVRVPAE